MLPGHWKATVFFKAKYRVTRSAPATNPAATMLHPWISKFQRHRRRVRLRRAGAQLHGSLQSFDEFFSGPASGFRCEGDVYLSAGSKIAMGSHGGEPGRLTIGAGVYVNHYAIINCHHSITVGRPGAHRAVLLHRGF